MYFTEIRSLRKLLSNSIKLLFLLAFSIQLGAQATNQKQLVLNDDFAAVIDKYLDESVELVSVDDLENELSQFTILDAREIDEYQISHIPGALYIGHDDPDFSVLKEIDKTEEVLLYCSIGYRSEKIGEKLESMGYTNVHNLYGSIFEWVNQGNPVVNTVGDTVQMIHTYNKSWGKWMENNLLEKRN